MCAVQTSTLGTRYQDALEIHSEMFKDHLFPCILRKEAKRLHMSRPTGDHSLSGPLINSLRLPYFNKKINKNGLRYVTEWQDGSLIFKRNPSGLWQHFAITHLKSPHIFEKMLWCSETKFEHLLITTRTLFCRSYLH